LSVELTTALMFLCLLVLLATGLPLVFCLGCGAAVFAFTLWGPTSLMVISSSVFNYMNNFLLVCIPLFIFMAQLLERSGIADALYNMMHHWFGPVRGGLAMGTVVICTIFAAMSGVSAAGTLTMGLVALPAMLERGYDKHIATGCILAGGALGILIPPSIAMIIYCVVAQVSVGRMFIGGMRPGLITSGLFITYRGIRCVLQPKLGPSLPSVERGNWGVKLNSLRAVILPVLIIIAVLGTIFTGTATPTEASAIGAFACMICAGICRKLNWHNLKNAAVETLKPTAMVMWIIAAASAFASIYNGLGATELIRKTIADVNVEPILIIIAMQISVFILGMILDPSGITLITLPIYIPIVTALGYDLVWFGILFVMNLEMAYITPPFGWNLFYLKGISPPGISIKDIYSSVFPFVALQATGLIIVLTFPKVALFLPNLMIK